MAYSDTLADLIKSDINLLFATPTLQNSSLFASGKNLDIAAINWLVLEVESYTSIITTRKCYFVKVRKTFVYDQTLDVDLVLTVSGGISEPIMFLKGVVTVAGSTCLLRLNDWTTHINGEVRGRVVNASGAFKLDAAPSATPASAPGPARIYYGNDTIV